MTSILRRRGDCKMQVQTFQTQVNIPNADDFAIEYPHYGPLQKAMENSFSIC